VSGLRARAREADSAALLVLRLVFLGLLLYCAVLVLYPFISIILCGCVPLKQVSDELACVSGCLAGTFKSRHRNAVARGPAGQDADFAKGTRHRFAIAGDLSRAIKAVPECRYVANLARAKRGRT
jgi:hypothetical protein